jgi:hypothetical protein
MVPVVKALMDLDCDPVMLERAILLDGGYGRIFQSLAGLLWSQ